MNEVKPPQAGPAPSKSPLVVLDQRANFAEAKKLATEHKGRLPSLQEFIRLIQDPQLAEKLRGDWFWTSDEQAPVKPEGYCRIDYAQGQLVAATKSEWEALPKAQKAYMLAGSGPVAISVGDYWFGGRLYGGPGAAAPGNGARVAVAAPK